MSNLRSPSHSKPSLLLWGLVFLGSLIAFLLLNIAIAKFLYRQPQAILTLGGNPEREALAAKLAKQNSKLLVWVSSGSSEPVAQRIFSEAGIPQERYFLDYRATDTVTNFTSLITDFKQHQLKHVYLITSDYHMPRARAIGTIILGSQGIIFTPMEVRTKSDREPLVKTLRDLGRSILWIFSGYTGARSQDIKS